MISYNWTCEEKFNHLIQAMDIQTYNATVMNKIMQRRPNGLP